MKGARVRSSRRTAAGGPGLAAVVVLALLMGYSVVLLQLGLTVQLTISAAVAVCGLAIQFARRCGIGRSNRSTRDTAARMHMVADPTAADNGEADPPPVVWGPSR
jgi:hypothetical protein